MVQSFVTAASGGSVATGNAGGAGSGFVDLGDPQAAATTKADTALTIAM
jgi:hypothetical protein